MAVELVKLLPFNNVVASGVANADLSNLMGYSIEKLILQLGGTALTKAMLTGLQLKANGKIIFDSDGSKTDARMSYRSYNANAAFIVIDFLENRARSKLGLLGGALDTTLGIKNLRLEVTIAGATAPTLAGYAEVARPQISADMANIRPLIARVHRTTQTIGAAGTFPIQVPHMDPNAGGTIFKRIHLFSANATGIQVYRNGIVEHESIKAVNDWRQQLYGESPQASLYAFDPIVDNLQEDRVWDTRIASGCTTAQFMATFSAGETIIIEAEVLEPLDVY
jgi:hypothetical protein